MPVILWHYIPSAVRRNSPFLAQNQRFRRWITGVAVEDGRENRFGCGGAERSEAKPRWAFRVLRGCQTGDLTAAGGWPHSIRKDMLGTCGFLLGEGTMAVRH